MRGKNSQASERGGGGAQGPGGMCSRQLPATGPVTPRPKYFPRLPGRGSGCQRDREASHLSLHGRRPWNPHCRHHLDPPPQALHAAGRKLRLGKIPREARSWSPDAAPEAGKTQPFPGKGRGGIDRGPVTSIGKTEAGADGRSILIQKTKAAERRRRKERKREENTGVSGGPHAVPG